MRQPTSAEKTDRRQSADRFASEADLASIVADHFRGTGARVFPEIQLEAYSKRADMIALTPETLHVIETKLSFGIGVIAQAREWLGFAHCVWIAVPYVRRRREDLPDPAYDLRRDVCEWLGIGIIMVGDRASVSLPAKRCANPANIGILERLTVDHETYAAPGNADGRRLTPFARTRDAVLAYLRENPGATVKSIIANVPTHWPSHAARDQIIALAKRGGFPGVKARFDGRRYRLDLFEEEEEG